MPVTFDSDTGDIHGNGHILVTVRVNMPHVRKYGRNTKMCLTYGSHKMLDVGDLVLCPPTKLNPKWTKGVVIDIGGTGYQGRVKFVKATGKSLFAPCLGSS